MLGKLACLVLSKILRIGTAERNWKVKAIKSGQWVNPGQDKEASFDLCTVLADTCTGVDDQASSGWEVMG